MPLQFSFYQLPPLFAAVLSAGLLLLVWNRRDNALAITFIVFATGLLVWSLLYTIQLGFTTLSNKLIVYKLEYIGAAIVPTTWLVLTTQYAGHDDWLTRPVLTVLAIEPIIVLGLVATNHTHGLIYETATLTTDPIALAAFEFGVAYWINLAYSYLLVIGGITLLADVAVRGPNLYRRQATLLIAGAAIPLVANLVFAAGLSPVSNIDLTTFSFAVTAGVFAVSLFKFDLLTRTPIARRRMSDVLGDGFLVVDDTDHVVNYNDTATHLFEDLTTDTHLETLFDTTDYDDLDGREITTTNDERRHYQIRCRPLIGRQNHPVGYLIALREITDRKQYEQRLEVTNRLLRHNLRTDSNLILGHANNLTTEVSDAGQHDLDRIKTTANRLAELSDKATELETILHHREDLTTVDAVPITTRVVEQYRTTHPDITIDVTTPDEAIVETVAEDLLAVAIENLLENAIEHTDTDPEISVRITDSDPIEISVADNGPGIPDIERTVLQRGHETQLEHGSGLGLWLVHWITTESGGTVTFDENDPTGSIVTLTLPTPA